MADRPIIFSAAMVRALLAGSKTQTRRLATSPLRWCEPGDRLYVREAHAVASIFTDVVEVRYRASERASHTEFVEQVPIARAVDARVTWPKYRPSIHTPRWASRLTLIVEDVRVEPLQAISRDDVIAEGVTERDGAPIEGCWAGWHEPFAQLWSGLHARPGERWEDNPMVVALTFRVEKRNIDAEGSRP